MFKFLIMKNYLKLILIIMNITDNIVRQYSTFISELKIRLLLLCNASDQRKFGK